MVRSKSIHSISLLSSSRPVVEALLISLFSSMRCRLSAFRRHERSINEISCAVTSENRNLARLYEAIHSYDTSVIFDHHLALSLVLTTPQMLAGETVLESNQMSTHPGIYSLSMWLQHQALDEHAMIDRLFSSQCDCQPQYTSISAAATSGFRRAGQLCFRRCGSRTLSIIEASHLPMGWRVAALNSLGHLHLCRTLVPKRWMCSTGL